MKTIESIARCITNLFVDTSRDIQLYTMGTAGMRITNMTTNEQVFYALPSM